MLATLSKVSELAKTKKLKKINKPLGTIRIFRVCVQHLPVHDLRLHRVDPVDLGVDLRERGPRVLILVPAAVHKLNKIVGESGIELHSNRLKRNQKKGTCHNFWTKIKGLFITISYSSRVQLMPEEATKQVQHYLLNLISDTQSLI